MDDIFVDEQQLDDERIRKDRECQDGDVNVLGMNDLDIDIWRSKVTQTTFSNVLWNFTLGMRMYANLLRPYKVWVVN